MVILKFSQIGSETSKLRSTTGTIQGGPEKEITSLSTRVT